MLEIIAVLVVWTAMATAVLGLHKLYIKRKLARAVAFYAAVEAEAERQRQINPFGLS